MVVIPAASRRTAAASSDFTRIPTTFSVYAISSGGCPATGEATPSPHPMPPPSSSGHARDRQAGTLPYPEQAAYRDKW
jgi:hypothetical protein